MDIRWRTRHLRNRPRSWHLPSCRSLFIRFRENETTHTPKFGQTIRSKFSHPPFPSSSLHGRICFHFKLYLYPRSNKQGDPWRDEVQHRSSTPPTWQMSTTTSTPATNEEATPLLRWGVPFAFSYMPKPFGQFSVRYPSFRTSYMPKMVNLHSFALYFKKGN